MAASRERMVEAMRAAGLVLDEVNSAEAYLPFVDVYGRMTAFDSWDDVGRWLDGVVFDDAETAEAVERVMHPERFEDSGARRAEPQTIRVTGMALVDDVQTAANVYRSVFADEGITIFGQPEAIALKEIGSLDEIGLEVALSDYEAAIAAIVKAQDQLRARRDFSELQEDAAGPRREEPERLTVVVNVFGGPGSGKTTAALEVAEKLKKAGYVVEYAPEYAKELVWDLHDPRATETQRVRAEMLLDGSYASQCALYEEQLRRVRRCIGQCDFVVTDSPPLMGSSYLKERYQAQREDFETRALRDFNGMTSFNMVVRRSGDYEQAGRIHDRFEAARIDAAVERFLVDHEIYFGTYERSQVDRSIENMRKTHRRLTAHRADVAALKAASAARVNRETAPAAGAGVSGEGAQARREGEDDMADESYESTKVTFPFPDGGSKGSYFWSPPNRPQRVAVTFPPHTPELQNIEGEMIDISYAKMWVNSDDVSMRGEDGFRELSLDATNKVGEPKTIKVTRDIGHRGEDGRWVNDETIENRIYIKDLKEPMEQVRDNIMAYRRDSEATFRESHQIVKMPESYRFADRNGAIHEKKLFSEPVQGKFGRPRVAVTFPPHTPELQNIEGEDIDISYATMWVNASAVSQADEKGFRNVSFPKQNREGTPWNVEVRREQGHWENPEAEGPERGEWIEDPDIVDKVLVSNIKQAMDFRYESGKDWVREQREKNLVKQQEAPAQAQSQDRKPRPTAPASKRRQAPSVAGDAKVAADSARSQVGRRAQAKAQAK